MGVAQAFRICYRYGRGDLLAVPWVLALLLAATVQQSQAGPFFGLDSLLQSSQVPATPASRSSISRAAAEVGVGAGASAAQGGKSQVSGPSGALPSGVNASGGHQAELWIPRTNKYLLLYCSSGRMSNQVACVKRTLHLAALLNRTLLVPSKGVIFFHGKQIDTWSLDTLVDWGRLRECLQPAYGPRTVMRVSEYLKMKKLPSVVVDQVYCIGTNTPKFCINAKRHHAFMEANGHDLKFPPLSSYPQWLVPSAPESQQHAQPVPDADIRASVGGVEDDVLCVGEMFGFGFEKQERRGGFDLERPSECNNLWHPHRAIVRFVHSAISNNLGTDYAAIHLRRGDFYLMSIVSKGTQSAYTDYKPIAHVAIMMAKILKERNLKSLYIATDASKVEVGLFTSLINGLADVKNVFTLGGMLDDAQGRGQPSFLRLAGAEKADVPLILADKNLCAGATLFLGTRGSSFSMDIEEMRCHERRQVGHDEGTLRCSSSECQPVYC